MLSFKPEAFRELLIVGFDALAHGAADQFQGIEVFGRQVFHVPVDVADQRVRVGKLFRQFVVREEAGDGNPVKRREFDQHVEGCALPSVFDAGDCCWVDAGFRRGLALFQARRFSGVGDQGADQMFQLYAAVVSHTRRSVFSFWSVLSLASARANILFAFFQPLAHGFGNQLQSVEIFWIELFQIAVD